MTADPYRDCIHIAAEPEIVFEYFTNAEALARWMGDRAVVDPRPGGQFTVFFADRRVEGRYLEVDRPRRLVISWGRAGSRSFPPGISVLEVTLTAHDGGTLVVIAHSGLPAANGTGTPSTGAITWPAWHWPPPAVTWHRA